MNKIYELWSKYGAFSVAGIVLAVYFAFFFYQAGKNNEKGHAARLACLRAGGELVEPYYASKPICVKEILY